MIPVNGRVLNSRSLLVFLSALLLAGCTTTSRRNQAGLSDWKQGAVDRVTVAPPPAIAPPPATAPAAPPATAPPAALARPAELSGTWVPLNRWCQANGLPAPVLQSAAAPPAYLVRSSHGGFFVRVGSQSAAWDGMEVRLGFPPRLVNGQPSLHALDLRANLQPLLLRGSALGLESRPVIVLDAGHGGENAGTRSVLGDYFEKDYALDWAMRVREALVTNGWEVWLTRTNDIDLALSNRVAFAERHNADLFLSLHFNSAAPNEVESGLETYCLTPAGMPSTLVRGLEDDASTVFPNNAFDAQNLRLALQVHRSLLQVNGKRDRGVRRARFPGVLRNQQRPAILIEGGYLSNPREARLIHDAAYRQKLAEAVAQALLQAVPPGQLEVRRARPDATGSGQESQRRPEPGTNTLGLAPRPSTPAAAGSAALVQRASVLAPRQ